MPHSIMVVSFNQYRMLQIWTVIAVSNDHKIRAADRTHYHIWFELLFKYNTRHASDL